MITAGKRLKRVLQRWNGPIVLEVTEHAPVANYEAFRWAVGRVGNVEVSIDDAGAGYASLRHILEIGPAWVKLDLTLVRNIDADPLRQALVAGLAHFSKTWTAADRRRRGTRGRSPLPPRHRRGVRPGVPYRPARTGQILIHASCVAR